MSVVAVRFEGITKRFPGVIALDDVHFEVGRGSVHAICGENGAGKSTLGKILAGIQGPDSGTLHLDGRPVAFASPREALSAGVAMVHQELVFCDNLSVAENLCLSALPRRGVFVRRQALRLRAQELLADVGAESIDPSREMSTLSVAEQQVVQIAAAVASNARVVVFDEPTSSLGEEETRRLYSLIAELRRREVTMLFVSHRMPEIYRLCDTISVLRDGRHVCTEPVTALSEALLVQRMIGRRVEQYFPAHRRAPSGPELLRVEGLSSPGRFIDVSFDLRAGEVVGLAGLVGSGRSEVAQAIFGLDSKATGRVVVRGSPLSLRSPRSAMSHGIGFVPEDRKKQGLVLSMTSRENVTLPTLPRLARLGWIDRRRERQVAGEFFERLSIRAPVMEVPALQLSGGNQQKLVLAKWLAARSNILMLDEPTRGVDVGAKAELHAWIDRLAAAGAAVLLISSELPELINLSSRILVLRAGRLVGTLGGADASQDRLLRMMTGMTSEMDATGAPTAPTSTH